MKTYNQDYKSKSVEKSFHTKREIKRNRLIDREIARKIDREIARKIDREIARKIDRKIDNTKIERDRKKAMNKINRQVDR